MQRKTRRIIAAVAVIALLAAGGAAFTASIQGLDGNNANIGFGSETVTGATATAVNYTLDTAGQNIESVAVTLTGDFSAADNTTTPYSFLGNLTDGTGAAGSGTPVGTSTCVAGSESAGSTVVTCTPTSPVAVNTVNGFQLSVTGGDSQSGDTNVTR